MITNTVLQVKKVAGIENIGLLKNVSYNCRHCTVKLLTYSLTLHTFLHVITLLSNVERVRSSFHLLFTNLIYKCYYVSERNWMIKNAQENLPVNPYIKQDLLRSTDCSLIFE